MKSYEPRNLHEIIMFFDELLADIKHEREIYLSDMDRFRIARIILVHARALSVPPDESHYEVSVRDLNAVLYHIICDLRSELLSDARINAILNILRSIPHVRCITKDGA